VDAQALILSLQLAAIVCLSLLVIGLPIAYWIAFSPWRWKFLVESVVALPLVLPPTVLGFYVLLAIGARSPLGQAWSGMFGQGLAFSFEGLVLASILYSLPFAVQPFAAAFSQVDRGVIEAAALLGASRLRTFLQIIIPLSINGVVTGIVLSFAHTLGEFGVVMMVGGNLPGETRTVSVAIYDDVQALEYARANSTAFVLLLFSVGVLALVYALNRRAWQVAPGP
jgi:molybdate transport system permease protein